MCLEEQEYQLFLDALHSLFLFAGKKEDYVPLAMDINTYRFETTTRKKINCSNCFYNNPDEILTLYLEENPDNFGDAMLEIVKGFRQFKKDRFYVFRYVTHYTVFLNDKIPYAVLGVTDPFQYLLGKHLPMLVETTLLPFKDKIVYDGILQIENYQFSTEEQDALLETYKKGKAHYGIVSSLPFDGKTVYEELDPSERLSYFMQSQANREEFDPQIHRIIREYKELLTQYHQTWSRIDAYDIRKRFKNLKLRQKAHYAILQGHLISSNISKKALQQTVKELVPEERLGWVHYIMM